MSKIVQFAKFHASAKLLGLRKTLFLSQKRKVMTIWGELWCAPHTFMAAGKWCEDNAYFSCPVAAAEKYKQLGYDIK